MILYKNLLFNLSFREYHPPLYLSFWSSKEFLKNYRRITGTDVGFVYEVINSELTVYMEADAPERLFQSMKKYLAPDSVEKELTIFDGYLRKLRKTVEDTRNKKINKKELPILFKKIIFLLGNLYPYSNAFYLLTQELEKSIKNKLKNKYSKKETASIMVSLSEPVRNTSINNYSEAITSIAEEIKIKYGAISKDEITKKYKDNEWLRKKINSLLPTYYCLTSLNGGARTIESFFPDIAVAMVARTKNKKHQIPSIIKKEASFLRAIIYFKDELSSFVVPYIKYGLQREWHVAADILGVSPNDLEQLQISEIISLLNNKKNLRHKIKRRKESTFFFHSPYHSTVVFEGATAKKEMKVISKQTTFTPCLSQNKIMGQTGSPGRIVKGVCQRILKSSEIINFKEGNILVAVYTAPEFVPAMKKAMAIVTDTGGITCHAAIVARELGKPCIIGTKIATQMLKDGDLVEVDANKGIVRKIKRDK